jgi:hypothetical protein
MPRTLRLVWVVAALPLAVACGTNEPAPSTASAPTTASPQSKVPESKAPEPVARKKIVLTQGGGGAGEALCTFFTAEEIGSHLGAEVKPGIVTGPLDSACQWLIDDPQGGNVMIQTSSDQFWSEPKNDPGAHYQPVKGVGDQAYTAVGMFKDWTAAAKHGTLVTIVSIRSPEADAALALELLKKTLGRM